MADDYYFDPRVASTYDAEIVSAGAVVLDDIAFYTGLAREAAATGQSVLELGCGTGRVTIPMARTGAQVVGLDYSPAMLEIAREKAALQGLADIRWVEADMSHFELEQRFGLVVIPFRSFLMLLNEKEQASCLGLVHEHLVEGGRFALNFFNPAVYDPAPRRSTLSQRGFSRLKRNLRVRHVPRAEMERLLASAGFEIEALYGWFDRRPFSESSSEMIWLARSCK